MKNIYTDLALEERESLRQRKHIEGVKMQCEKVHQLKMTTTIVDILNSKGEETLKKPKGTYITMESGKFKDIDENIRKQTAHKLSYYLNNMIENKKIRSVLVVGLGNSLATPDALGPKTVDNINVDEHIYCIAPGVMSQTGMETYDIIKGIVAEVNPEIVIVIDSLAARNVRRITTTIQLTNTGIIPGSGIGNHRKGINSHTLNRKVIAIGVPMVVSGATIVKDTMENLIDILSHVPQNAVAKMFEDYDENEKYQLFEELLSKETEQMFVTPKDVDEIVENLSKTIAHGINEFCSQALCGAN